MAAVPDLKNQQDMATLVNIAKSLALAVEE
jgi:hypothetical protein